MVIDSSALLAILLQEKEAASFTASIQNADVRRISAASYLETAIVIDNRGDVIASREFDRFLRVAGITIEPVTARQSLLARQAYRDFGKGRHRAKVNFGDCLSYALAKDLDEPLLFKGIDFTKTDVKVAIR